MKSKVEAAYLHCVGRGCITMHVDEQFYIMEPPAPYPCCKQMGKPDEDADFLVENYTGQEVSLLAIDRCLYDERGPSRCDCAVINNNTIAFIEFKLGTSNKRTERLKEARQQLIETIKRFKNHAIVDSSTFIRAYAHVGFHQTKPAHNATLQAATAYLTEAFPELNIEFFAENKTVFN